VVQCNKHEWVLDVGAKEPIARCGCGAWCVVDIENNQWGEVHGERKEDGMVKSTKRSGAELDARWPELKGVIEQQKNLNQAAKECGVAYSTLLGCCKRHKFDVTPYRPFVAAARESAKRPCKTDAESSVLPRGIQVLIDMLPVSGVAWSGKGAWKAAFDAMFDLIYG
jgi:hypothetical protein